nr:helix-turn-helix domain-containing protein [Hyalangium gracile]
MAALGFSRPARRRRTAAACTSVLQVMAESPGRVFTRERLLDLARGDSEEAFDRSIDVHVFRLRQKLRDNPRRPRLLKTVRGVGYALVAEADA